MTSIVSSVTTTFVKNRDAQKAAKGTKRIVKASIDVRIEFLDNSTAENMIVTNTNIATEEYTKTC